MNKEKIFETEEIVTVNNAYEPRFIYSPACSFFEIMGESQNRNFAIKVFFDSKFCQEIRDRICNLSDEIRALEKEEHECNKTTNKKVGERN